MPSPFARSVLRQRCPRCGVGKLFGGFLDLLPRCEACGLDYGFARADDGPTTVILLAMGAPVTAFGLWLEFAFDPPLWVHLVTTVPLVILACILPLRFIKAALVAAAYSRLKGGSAR